MASTAFFIATLLTLCISYPATSQKIASPPSFAPAPAPGPHFVNLADLLSVAGPFHTFLNYLNQTQVIKTFQNQANDTDQGITIFVPKDSAFSAIKKPAFANLTQDQLKSLLLLHAIPKYYSLSEFKNLSSSGPVNTFAGGPYALNLTDASGLIRIGSDWANTKITSSVYSTYPVAVYEVDKVLLPKAIFSVEPPMAPAPAPTPDESPVAADAPTGAKGVAGPKGSDSKKSDSGSSMVVVGVMSYLAVVASVAML
ncbi:uncharacterized protein A4U43_C05F20860 [Asparagus officinalis]|uniref:FAS1 domain-containing protein n=1 Tax=Asparagus officinalis TaxID=4686 RepID=A0A5P1EVQ3_ASPOF|nr:fasciclin-like arabinogalactan protein 7 [Asparagus officinalis]ONK69247.1 uncharacterized protein A4U43_C05F20860 [Asparagus officinalis]